jgi:hypothetical protein
MDVEDVPDTRSAARLKPTEVAATDSPSRAENREAARIVAMLRRIRMALRP